MDAKLSIEEILVALHGSCIWNKRSDMFVPNVSWGLLNHEADLVIVNKTGYLTEVEIKRSWEDFKADFKKKHTHNDERVYRFYYCVPVSILDKVKEFLLNVAKDETPRKNPPALIYYTEDGRVKIEDFGVSHKEGARKLFLEERLTVARLGVLRYWNLLEKVCPLKKNGKGNNTDLFVFLTRMFYVINKEGKALMPTERCGKVRRLPKLSCHMVRRIPFTIQLDYDTTDFTQPVTLGIDAGSRFFGVSATTDRKDLYAAEVELRNDIVEKMSTRREQRRTRRYRLRYRKPRFDNRVASKRKGCPASSGNCKKLRLIDTSTTLLTLKKESWFNSSPEMNTSGFPRTK